MSRTLVCPYCYEASSERRAVFRCRAQPTRAPERRAFRGPKLPPGVEADETTGRPPPCGRTVDPVLRDRRGRNESVGPVFDASGRSKSAPCPHCGNESADRVCPHCHELFPVDYTSRSSRLIAMVGAKATGKSVFTTVLVHEFRHNLGRRLNGALNGWDDHTQTRFSKELEPELYLQGRLHMPTMSAGSMNAGQFNPLIYRFSRKEDGPLKRHSRAILSLFDAAGEDLNSQDSIALHARYLHNAEGLLLLIDPLQLPGARREARAGIALPPGEGERAVATVVENIVNMLQRDPRLKRGALVTKPVAVVLSKIDAFDLDPGSPLRRPEPRDAGFDRSDADDVHAQVQNLLHQWGADDIDSTLAASFRNYRYFGLSALGDSPTRDAPGQVFQNQIRPYRVGDPVVWLFHEFGIVPALRAARPGLAGRS